MCLFLKNEISLKVSVSDLINSITLQDETFHQEKKKIESKPTPDFDSTDKKIPMHSLCNLILNTAKLSSCEVFKSIENDLSHSPTETYFVYFAGDFLSS